MDSQQDGNKLNKQLVGIFDYHSQNNMSGWVCLVGLNQWYVWFSGLDLHFLQFAYFEL